MKTYNLNILQRLQGMDREHVAWNDISLVQVGETDLDISQLFRVGSRDLLIRSVEQVDPSADKNRSKFLVELRVRGGHQGPPLLQRSSEKLIKLIGSQFKE